MTQQEYTIDLDVIDYKIMLDSNKHIQSIYSRNQHFTQIREHPSFNPMRIIDALSLLCMYDFEKFQELSNVLQENDTEMFKYASMVANKFATSWFHLYRCEKNTNSGFAMFVFFILSPTYHPHYYLLHLHHVHSHHSFHSVHYNRGRVLLRSNQVQ